MKVKIVVEGKGIGAKEAGIEVVKLLKTYGIDDAALYQMGPMTYEVRASSYDAIKDYNRIKKQLAPNLK